MFELSLLLMLSGAVTCAVSYVEYRRGWQDGLKRGVEAMGREITDHHYCPTCNPTAIPHEATDGA